MLENTIKFYFRFSLFEGIYKLPVFYWLHTINRISTTSSSVELKSRNILSLVGIHLGILHMLYC